MLMVLLLKPIMPTLFFMMSVLLSGLGLSGLHISAAYTPRFNQGLTEGQSVMNKPIAVAQLLALARVELVLLAKGVWAEGLWLTVLAVVLPMLITVTLLTNQWVADLRSTQPSKNTNQQPKLSPYSA